MDRTEILLVLVIVLEVITMAVSLGLLVNLVQGRGIG